MKSFVVLACAILLLATLVRSSGDVSEDLGNAFHRIMCRDFCVNIFQDSSEECVAACLVNDKSYKPKTPAHLTGPQICRNLCKFVAVESVIEECTSACNKEREEKAKAG